MSLLKKGLLVVALLATAGTAYTLTNFSTRAFGDSTGAPMKQGTSVAYNSCNNVGCHTGNPLNSPQGSVTVSSDIPSSGWVPGRTYTITIRGSFPNRDVFGWQAMVWGNADSASIGRIATVPNGVGTVSLSLLRRSPLAAPYDTNYYFGHRSADLAVPTLGRSEVSFLWTAPNEPGANTSASIYARFVAANGNGNNVGDFVLSGSASYLSAPASSQRLVTPVLFKAYPNPATDAIKFHSPWAGEVSATIADISGKIYSKELLNTAANEEVILPVHSLPTGTYWLQLINAQGQKAIATLVKQ